MLTMFVFHKLLVVEHSPMQPYKDYGKSMHTCHCGLTCNLMTQLLKETIFGLLDP